MTIQFRSPDDCFTPEGLEPTERIAYVLDGEVAERYDLAGNLYWGNEAGRIVAWWRAQPEQPVPLAHAHYYKDVSHLRHVDVYRVLQLFGVTDPCIGHAVKKLLVAGGRGAGKDIGQDVQEAIDSLTRWQAMAREDWARAGRFVPTK